MRAELQEKLHHNASANELLFVNIVSHPPPVCNKVIFTSAAAWLTAVGLTTVDVSLLLLDFSFSSAAPFAFGGPEPKPKCRPPNLPQHVRSYRSLTCPVNFPREFVVCCQSLLYFLLNRAVVVPQICVGVVLSGWIDKHNVVKEEDLAYERTCSWRLSPHARRYPLEETLRYPPICILNVSLPQQQSRQQQQ